ncbi:hypothetical protein CDD81_3209 [Ophiocordyceps australis]|uniref:Uncharacterized protein n=1 Tax=Ophiocordyceps australis TaxID=1399860 RepID=A0A2C5XVK3_9HYPO|nr:hypothetical protein CDD81_3209 [Ophiocordyceps australis]
MSLPPARLYARPTLYRITISSRAISNTASYSSNIPPESPSYVRLPTPPQSDEKKPARMRGSLPVPRNIFPWSERNRKVQPEYIERTAPKPTNQPDKLTPDQEWKAQLADARRTNLEQGLQSLWKRRLRSDKNCRIRQARKSEGRRRALEEPEREDDRVTRGTVLKALLNCKVYPDPERFYRAKKSRQRVFNIEKHKREARREALTQLYINASSFIVDEDDLKNQLDNIFSENAFASQPGNGFNNIWGLHGPPPTIENMIAASSGKLTSNVDPMHDADYTRISQRHKMLAETLTGAKLT